MKKLVFIAFIAIILSSCTSKKAIVTPVEEAKPVMSAEEMRKVKANELAQKYIITDGHVDLPYRLKVRNFRLEKEYLGIPIETDDGDFDYVRAKKGGLDAPFMSIYIPFHQTIKKMVELKY